jgi:hypothetical protein
VKQKKTYRGVFLMVSVVENAVSVNDPKSFEILSDLEKQSLLSWIESNLTKKDTFNHRHSSYGLKNLFESSETGFYLTNGAFKGAMLVGGFKVKDASVVNWQFNISSASVNKLRKSS